MNACVCECRCRNVWLREEKACMAFCLAHTYTCACSARRMCVMFMRLRLCLCVCERAGERGCAKLQHFLAQIGREVTPMQEGRSKKMQWNFSQMLAERGGGGGGVPGRVGGWIEEVRR